MRACAKCCTIYDVMLGIGGSALELRLEACAGAARLVALVLVGRRLDGTPHAHAHAHAAVEAIRAKRRARLAEDGPAVDVESGAAEALGRTDAGGREAEREAGGGGL